MIFFGVFLRTGGDNLLTCIEKRSYSTHRNTLNNNLKTGRKIARFGITTKSGPSFTLIDETIMETFSIIPPKNGHAIAAIIYMFVEPEYRGNGIGELALEVITAIHAFQRCNFTVLVADDNGNGKLIKWYKRNGFMLAPKLGELFGSPGGKYGPTMIKSTSFQPDFLSRCQIKWW